MDPDELVRSKPSIVSTSRKSSSLYGNALGTTAGFEQQAFAPPGASATPRLEKATKDAHFSKIAASSDSANTCATAFKPFVPYIASSSQNLVYNPPTARGRRKLRAHEWPLFGNSILHTTWAFLCRRRVFIRNPLHHAFLDNNPALLDRYVALQVNDPSGHARSARTPAAVNFYPSGVKVREKNVIPVPTREPLPATSLTSLASQREMRRQSRKPCRQQHLLEAKQEMTSQKFEKGSAPSPSLVTQPTKP
jgi:hypothetical protein